MFMIFGSVEFWETISPFLVWVSWFLLAQLVAMPFGGLMDGFPFGFGECCRCFQWLAFCSFRFSVHPASSDLSFWWVGGVRVMVDDVSWWLSFVLIQSGMGLVLRDSDLSGFVVAEATYDLFDQSCWLRGVLAEDFSLLFLPAWCSWDDPYSGFLIGSVALSFCFSWVVPFRVLGWATRLDSSWTPMVWGFLSGPDMQWRTDFLFL